MKREIEIVLLKLKDGARILRFCEAQSGLCLEKRLNSSEPVLSQESHWKETFRRMLEQEEGRLG